MNVTVRMLVVLAAAGLAAAGCSDPTAVKAQLKITEPDTVTVYALNGSPAGAPTAIELSGPVVARADASFGFSVAFDLDSANNTIVIPVQMVANHLASTNSVGLQPVSTAFADISKAPGGAYKYDSTYVLPAGKAVVAEIVDQARCAVTYYSTTYYSKFMITAVDTAQRSFKVVVVTDPNCGFRSLVSGTTPKD